jgi:hypothetical protein
MGIVYLEGIDFCGETWESPASKGRSHLDFKSGVEWLDFWETLKAELYFC